MDDEMDAHFILFLDYFGWIDGAYVPLGNELTIDKNFLFDGFTGAQECDRRTRSFFVIMNKSPTIVITGCLVIIS